jgi:hypothetical protein
MPSRSSSSQATLLIQLGGPGMLIGLGGGAASSMATGSNTADLDFASVQRGNPEIERRAQEVIDRCWQMGENNPILAIHDVGAGGISNAMPELAHDAGCGAASSTCAPCPPKNRACRRARSGATNRKSATCSPSRRNVSMNSAPCANASAARLPCSVSPPTTIELDGEGRSSSATSRWTCPWKCCWASRRKMHRNAHAQAGDGARRIRCLTNLDLKQAA